MLASATYEQSMVRHDGRARSAAPVHDGCAPARRNVSLRTLGMWAWSRCTSALQVPLEAAGRGGGAGLCDGQYLVPGHVLEPVRATARRGTLPDQFFYLLVNVATASIWVHATVSSWADACATRSLNHENLCCWAGHMLSTLSCMCANWSVIRQPEPYFSRCSVVPVPSGASTQQLSPSPSA